MHKIIHSDCLEALKAMPDNSIDSIVTDPPYGLSFMGKKWDYDVPGVEIWKEAFRVLKPGGHILAFAGTRTQHRMAVNIEDAGFEIRDMIMWVYGSGFPKSMDIGKAIDKVAGEEREVVGTIKKMPSAGGTNTNEGWKRPWAEGKTTMNITAPATEAAKQWDGWGTALKLSVEPITVARKPVQKTVAENVLQWGTGGINIDGCRVETKEGDEVSNHGRKAVKNGWDPRMSGSQTAGQTEGQKLGRWPANFIHDGSDEALGLFPDTGASKSSKRGANRNGNVYGKYGLNDTIRGHDDNGGSAARFFYCAKASTSERNEGLDALETKQSIGGGGGIGQYLLDVNSASGKYGSEKAPAKNHHPTVKPINLMRYLCRLVTPPAGTILDMFMGSGTTIIAASLEGFNAIGIEREKEYIEIAEKRIKHWTAQNTLL